MRSMTQILMMVVLLVGSTGCSYLFWPRAGDYRTQAKGATGIETMVNLTNMMEASARPPKAAKVSTIPWTISTISSMRSTIRSAT